MTIPPIIFQTWRDTRVVPLRIKPWMESLKQLNPSYRFIFWNDDQNRRFASRMFPWFMDTYNSYPAEIYRADAIRYMFLYCFGGFYIDIDTECFRPLDDLLCLDDVLLGRMGNDEAFSHSIPNAIMASTARQEFWLFMLSAMQGVAPSAGRPEEMTGPVLLGIALRAYLELNDEERLSIVSPIASQLPSRLKPKQGPSSITILSDVSWYPLNWALQSHRELLDAIKQGRLESQTLGHVFADSWLITYWEHSWEEIKLL